MEGKWSGELAGAVSDAVSSVWAETHGVGPTAAKTYRNDRFLFTVLHGGLTAQECTLLQAGQEGLVRQTRVGFEEVLRDRYSRVIEELVGERVVDYHSQVLFRTQVTVEIFVLDG